MSNLKTILTSFKLKDELNPKIWDLPTDKTMSGPEGQKEKMKPNVRKRLILISKSTVSSASLSFKLLVNQSFFTVILFNPVKF